MTATDSPIQKAQLLECIAPMAEKMNALTIIIGAPLWPREELLSKSGKALHDAIVRDAKPYALHVVREELAEAFALAASWPANEFMENTQINDPDAMVRLANHRMLRVYKHYMDATGIYWPAIEKGNAA